MYTPEPKVKLAVASEPLQPVRPWPDQYFNKYGRGNYLGGHGTLIVLSFRANAKAKTAIKNEQRIYK